MCDILLSVIVPTFNRATCLKKTLKLLEVQDFPTDSYEIIVVDDCSTDGTREYLEKASFAGNFQYLRNSRNSGRARTRNCGLRAAKGRYVLMIDDDIWANRRLISEHYRIHIEHPEGVVVAGAIFPSPEVRKTAVNQFLNNHHTWCYSEMKKNRGNLPYTFCKTANLSMTRELIFRIGLLNEFFVHYGAEDTELGLRLAHENIRLLFAEKAVGYHYHEETVDSIIEKERERMKSNLVYSKLHSFKGEGGQGGFFSTFYHKGFGFKSLFYNILKFFLFTRIAGSLNRAFIMHFNEKPSLNYVISSYLVPLLRLEYAYQASRSVRIENRN
jgi:glycosyltransferase involved in cell wall biosynthesis